MPRSFAHGASGRALNIERLWRSSGRGAARRYQDGFRTLRCRGAAKVDSACTLSQSSRRRPRTAEQSPRVPQPRPTAGLHCLGSRIRTRLLKSHWVRRGERLAAPGADAMEVSCNAMRLHSDSAKEYVAVGPARALRDLLLHRLLWSVETPTSSPWRAPSSGSRTWS